MGGVLDPFDTGAREVGKCMFRQPRQSDTLNFQRHPLRGFHCHHSSSTLPLHHIFLCVVSQLKSGERRFYLPGRRAGQTQPDRCSMVARAADHQRGGYSN